MLSNGSGMPGVEIEEGATRDDTEASAIGLQGEEVVPKDFTGLQSQDQNVPLQEETTQEEDPLSHVNGVSPAGETPSKSSKPKKPATLIRRRIMIAIQLSCLLLAVAVLVQSRGPYIKPSTPFFPRHSLISDFYTGDIVGLTERLLMSDLSCVVYYAPWDRDSQVLRWELEKVARYHHEQIYFAAINCWHPRSECRTKYKIRSFPAIIIHVRSANGLETRAMAYGGPKDAGHIIRFLSRTLRPLSHVTSHADLARLQMEYSAVVLGFYEFSSMSHLPKGFNSFYIASIRALGYDHTQKLAWGVVTNAHTARALSFNDTRSIHIVLWNTTLVYTTASKADSEGITSWVLKRLDETATWVEVTGTKSLALHKILEEGPTLIVFSPDNPYYTANDPFTLLREVSLDYNNCDESTRVNNLGQYIGSVRSRGRGILRQAERICRSYLKDQLSVLHLSRQQLNFKDETCCRTMSPGESKSHAIRNDEKVCDVCIHSPNKLDDSQSVHCSSPSSWEEESDLLQHVNNLMAVFSDSCRELMLQYSPWQHYSVCCQRNVTSKTKTPYPAESSEEKRPQNNYVETGLKDDRIERLVAMSAEDQCKRLFHGSLLAAPALLKDQQPAPPLTGLGCKTNKTLAFIAIDSLHHKNVAERLGINMTAKEPSNTAAVIVDLERETHFILDAALSKPTLVNFILNYTNGLLDRTLVSNHQEDAECELGHLCIKDLTTESYLSVTQRPGQMVVVLHYSKSCAACTTVGHVFLNVANAARNLPNVTFARIDTLTNILPWHLYFENLPAIIVHPHFRKSESRIYDSNRPLTPANLLSFVVANLGAGHRLLLALSTCREECEEQVLQASRVTTTQIHHTLTTSTAKLQHVVDRIAKLIADSNGKGSHFSSHNMAHYNLLTLTKAHLVRQIKKQRIKLIHLGQLNKLLSVALEKPIPVYGELLKSVYYITRRRNIALKDSSDQYKLHDEL